jgi:hypothetical protein
MVEFEITYTPDRVEAAYRRFWAKRFGVPYRILLGLLVALLVVALGMGSLPGYLLAAICVVVVIAALMRSTRESTVKLALELLDSLRPPKVRFRVDEVGITECSSLGQIHLTWPAFAGYVELEDFLLALRRPPDAGLFIALPTDQLPEAARTLIRERMEAIDGAWLRPGRRSGRSGGAAPRIHS